MWIHLNHYSFIMYTRDCIPQGLNNETYACIYSFGHFWSSIRSTSEKSQNYTDVSFQRITKFINCTRLQVETKLHHFKSPSLRLAAIRWDIKAAQWNTLKIIALIVLEERQCKLPIFVSCNCVDVTSNNFKLIIHSINTMFSLRQPLCQVWTSSTKIFINQ